MYVYCLQYLSQYEILFVFIKNLGTFLGTPNLKHIDLFCETKLATPCKIWNTWMP